MGKDPRRAALEQIAATENLLKFYEDALESCRAEIARIMKESAKWELALAKTKQRLEMMDANDMQAVRQG